MRESYGIYICGQSVLSARRLVKAGVPLAADKPCGPADLYSTVFHALGIPSDHMNYDRNDRQLPMCDGTPLPLFG